MPNDCTALPNGFGKMYSLRVRTGIQYIRMIVPAGNSNARRVRDAVIGTALGVGANMVRNAIVGAVQGTGQRVRRSARNFAAGSSMKNFQGDVNQPATAKTVQQVQIVRSRRGGANVGGVAHIESGTVKVADVTTSVTTAYNVAGAAIASIPITPTVLGGRVYVMSTIYSRWATLSLAVRYVPAVSSATDGGLVMYYTQENDDTYTVGELVGASNAASAMDNLEFSVREKASMKLHPPSQELYTTPGRAVIDPWHSAGVLNIISAGSLADNKTYGAVYLDYTIRFKQATSPYDVFAPCYVLPAKHPTGTGSTGTSAGPLFDWNTDVADFDNSGGLQWFYDPATGALDTSGRIHVPPYTSMAILVEFTDGGAVAANIGDTRYGNLMYSSRSIGALRSTDSTFKSYSAVYTNKGAGDASFSLNAGGAGYNLTAWRGTIMKVPFAPN